MENQVQYCMKEEIQDLFYNEVVKLNVTLTKIKPVKDCINDGEANFVVSFFNANTGSAKMFNVSILHFDKSFKGEKERNLDILSKEKDMKKIAKEVVTLLSKEAVKQEKDLCKRTEGHTRNFHKFPMECIAEILLPIMEQEKKEMADLLS